MTTSSASNRRYTYADLARMAEDHATRTEVIDGELFVNPAPVLKHQRVALRLARLLSDELADQGHGEVLIAPCDVVFDLENCVQPDILFVAKSRASIITEKNVQGAPDLCVEILSDGTRRRDLLLKRALYERFGVPRYWVIDPETDRLEIYALAGGHYGSPAVHESPAVVVVDAPASLRIDLAKLLAS